VAIAASMVGCRPAAPPRAAEQVAGGPVVRDDYGDTVPVGTARPRRIVSLNPTTTAMLFAMGEGARVVGRTHWDSYPAAVQSVTDLGDGLRPNVEAVLAQRPDLVVLYASSDDRAAAEAFRRAGVTTLSVRVDRMADFARVLRLLGAVVGDSAAAATVTDSVLTTVDRVRQSTAGLVPVTIAWPVEESPLRVIGGGSYLSELVTDAGGRNLYADLADPSPQVSIEDLLRRDPDAVLTSPSLAQSLRGNPGWREWLRDGRHRVLVPDTSLVGMPSVRMGEAAAQLAALLHPAGGR
jgi:ABC-type Fe3+-hydroxamate transport system substrate-binding protein